jgi:elongation factor 1 alpha-like protein
LEKAEKPKIEITTVVTTASKKPTMKGFEVNSPKDLTPVGSGRNTPDEDVKQPNKMTKEAMRNARELFIKERGQDKEQIHLVVIGHVDAGKSTMMGHLLYDLGNVPQKTMHKYEQESKKLGKQSFMYAWVLDETGEERNRGITMDCGFQRFETPTKQVTLLDAPGHRDFIPNMITGANQADCAILVVDATRGEFEAGFEQGGQTREHALLVRSLGVNQVCVAVNKLDNEKWSKERFDEIVGKLKIFLKQAGFKENEINYIPCSGLTGENLVKPTTENLLKEWWGNGPTLMNIIDNFKTPERAIDKPFRMSISDVYKGTGSNFCLSGRIASGHVCVNDKIIICPSKENGQVKSLTIDEVSVSSAFAGDQVSVTLTGLDSSNVSIGSVLSEIYNQVPLANKIRVRILVFNVKSPITIGFPVIMHHQSLIEPATISKLKAQLHKSTAEVVKKNPRVLGNNSCALVDLSFSRPIAIGKILKFFIDFQIN